MKEKFKFPLCIVCHDAGAANHIISWVLNYKFNLKNIFPFMEGPAKKIWIKNFPDVPLMRSMEDSIESSMMVLSGTGWEGSLEHDARKHALSHHKYSVATLDHWVNFSPRFTRDGQTIIPDEIWVVDSEAHHIACNEFGEKLIFQMPNFYLKNEVERIGDVSDCTNEFLYILEPIRNNWGRKTQGEFQALKYFFSKLSQLNIGPVSKIRLRLHPSERVLKYREWVSNLDLKDVEFCDVEESLHQSISRARWVAGCESYALIVAAASNRQVFISLPDYAPPCRLPNRNFIYLKDIEE